MEDGMNPGTQVRRSEGDLMKTGSHVFIAHSNGEIYEGIVQWQDAHLIHLRTSTGRIFIIMKADILSKS